MTDIQIFQAVIGGFYFLMMLSLLLNKEFWFKALLEVKDRPSTLISWGYLSASLGIIVIGFHNIWVADWPVVVTLFGWIALVKGVFILLAPNVYSKMIPSEKFLRKIIKIEAPIFAVICLGVVWNAMAA